MIWIDSRLDDNVSNQTTCLGIATAIHVALFFWNPSLFQNTWRTFTMHGNDGIIVIDMPGTEEPMPLNRSKLGRPPLPQQTARIPVVPHTAFAPRIGAPLYSSIPVQLEQ